MFKKNQFVANMIVLTILAAVGKLTVSISLQKSGIVSTQKVKMVRAKFYRYRHNILRILLKLLDFPSLSIVLIISDTSCQFIW